MPSYTLLTDNPATHWSTLSTNLLWLGTVLLAPRWTAPLLPAVLKMQPSKGAWLAPAGPWAAGQDGAGSAVGVNGLTSAGPGTWQAKIVVMEELDLGGF